MLSSAHFNYAADRDVFSIAATQPTEAIKLRAQRLEQELLGWQERVEAARSEHPQLNFYTNQQLLRMHTALAALAGSARESKSTSADILLLLLRRASPNLSSAACQARIPLWTRESDRLVLSDNCNTLPVIDGARCSGCDKCRAASNCAVEGSQARQCCLCGRQRAS